MSLLAQDERLTRRVGAIAIALIAAAILFFVFLYDRIEIGSRTRIKVYFHHSAGLRETAPLVVAGKEIGQVESIENVLHGASNLLHGEVGIVAIVAIDGDKAWMVPDDASVFVSSHGPLSAKYLELAPPRHDAPPGTPIREGGELLAADPPSLDNVLQHTWANMTTYRIFGEEVRPEWQALRTQIDKLREQLSGVAGDLDTLSPAIRGTAPLIQQARDILAEARKMREVALGGDMGFAAFRSTISDARTVLARTRAALDRLQPLAAKLGGDVVRIRDGIATHDPEGRIEGVIARARAAIDKIDPLLAKVDEINGRLARGEGSLGLLMHDPEFPEDAKELGKILKRQPWKVIDRPKE